MIEKFNFYDVYGYFLPGLALIAVLWLPFGLVSNSWPKGDWGSAIIAVALAYFAGHLVFYVSTKVVPSHDIQKSKSELETRMPSATVLDADSKVLSKELRERVAEVVNSQFRWQLHVEESTGKNDSLRNDAFALARQRLISNKSGSYSEQFQGMYSLSRGLAVVFAVASFYYFGWFVCTVFHGRFTLVVALIILFVSVAILLDVCVGSWWDDAHSHGREEGRPALTAEDRKRVREAELGAERRFALTALFAFAAAGVLAGSVNVPSEKAVIWLAAATAVAPIAALRSYRQYRSFTFHFAATVWRDFAACAQSPADCSKDAARFE